MIHGLKYNYDEVKQNDIQGAYSNISIICNTCGYSWNSTIHNHINSRRGCLHCAGKRPWDKDFFIETAKEIHGDRYNYDKITTEHIQGNKSRVPLKCNICKYEWEASIVVHISHKCGCPKCAGNAPWIPERLEDFLVLSKEIHHNIMIG